MKLLLYLLSVLVITTTLAYSQSSKTEENPFPKFTPYIAEKNSLPIDSMNYDIKELGKTQPAMWLQVDPMADKYPGWSPYNYTLCNPLRFVDPKGSEMTNFYDENGNLIQHVEDNSNATFTLTGETKDKQYFKFSGYEDQGGVNEVTDEALASVLSVSQDYTRTDFESFFIGKDANGKEKYQTYCNWGTRFIAKSVNSGLEQSGESINTKVYNGSAKDIYNNLTKEYKPVGFSAAQEAAKNGSFVVGAWQGHVFSFMANGKINNVGAPRPHNNIWNSRGKDMPSGTKFYIIH